MFTIIIVETGPSSMKRYCLDEVKKGRYKFPCPDPNCQRIWEYFLVRHVACFDDETRMKIEKKVTDNYISQGQGYQQCPGCNTWCIPIHHGDIRLQCGICTRGSGEEFDFCWACQCRWRSTSSRCCGNEGCDGKDPRLRILNTAEKKKIDNIPGCPSIRSCPKCGLLINLKEGCRHMTCTNCTAEFCFICLRRWIGKIHPPCTCMVAPVQVQLTDPLWDTRNDYYVPSPPPSSPSLPPSPPPPSPPPPSSPPPPANDSSCIIL